MLSKACQYAIKALLFISAETAGNTHRCTLPQIAEAIDSPVYFTSKILQKLVGSGLLQSVKGGKGGFSMISSQIRQTRLIHIIQAMGEDTITGACFLGLSTCSDETPCPIHLHYAPVRDQLTGLLNTTMLEIINEPGWAQYHLKG